MASTIANRELRAQAACFEWFHNSFPKHRKMLFNVDNNSSSRIEGNKKRSLGVTKGVSDFILVAPGCVNFIELKVYGGKQSDDQLEFQDKVTTRGHSYVVIFVEPNDISNFKNYINAALGNN